MNERDIYLKASDLIPKETEPEEELIPGEDPEEEEPEEYDPERFAEKLDQIKQIMDVVIGGETVGARVSPVLSPKNPKTTSILNRGEISMCQALIQFAKLSPEETEPALDFVMDKLALNLSLDGRGIDKSIDLGKALTQRDSSTTYRDEKSSPTEGMKDK